MAKPKRENWILGSYDKQYGLTWSVKSQDIYPADAMDLYLSDFAKRGENIFRLLWDCLLQGTVPLPTDKKNIDDYMNELAELSKKKE